MKLISSAICCVFAVMVLTALFCGSVVFAQEVAPADDSARDSLPADSLDTLEEQPAPALEEDRSESGIALPGEAVFREIELSPGGVVAFDSLGNRWYFNFEEDFFVLDPGGGHERVGAEWERNPDEIEPVEERCTERKTVRHPELKAVFVGYDEYVEGNIIAYDRVTVKGWVQGDIQSFKKRVLVTASGRVDGDIKAPYIEVKEGGEVLGEQIIIEPYQIPPIDIVISPFSTDGIWVVFVFTLAFLLVAFLAVSLAPRQLANISECISEHKVKTYFTGLLFILLLPVIIALLAITIVGIVAIALLPLSILVALVMGMAVSGRMLARSVLSDLFGQRQSLMFQSLFGVLVFMILWTAVAVLMGSGEGNGVAYGFGIFMLVVSIVVTTYPLLAGVGAAVLTRFGFKRYVSFGDQLTDRGDSAPAPAPPPISGSGPSSPSPRPIPRPPSFGNPAERPDGSSGE